jgi:hypothetical protein
MTGSGCVIGLDPLLKEGEESYRHIIPYALDQLSPKANLWHKLTVGQMSELGHSRSFSAGLLLGAASRMT